MLADRQFSVGSLRYVACVLDAYAAIGPRLARLGMGSLEDFYASELWRARRALWRLQHPQLWSCFVCGRAEPLELHHLSYARLGAELDGDLVPLCAEHHAAVHGFQRAWGVPLAVAHLAYLRHLEPWRWDMAHAAPPSGLEPDPWASQSAASDVGPDGCRAGDAGAIVEGTCAELPAQRRDRLGRAVAAGMALVALLAVSLAVHGLASSGDDSDVSVAFWACVLVVWMVRAARRPARARR